MIPEDNKRMQPYLAVARLRPQRYPINRNRCSTHFSSLLGSRYPYFSGGRCFAFGDESTLHWSVFCVWYP